MLDITISIVTYNSSFVINHLLDSILEELNNRLSYAIFVIDNNSKDNTLEILSNYNNKIEIIPLTKNIGFGAGHNVILNKINSKYHIVVNPDIILNTSILNDLFNYMEENPNIGMLTPKVKYPDGRIQYLCKIDPNFIDLFIRVFMPFGFKKRQARYMMLDYDYERSFLVSYASGCFMFFRSNIYKRINGFDEAFFLHFEDADITRRINEISKAMYFPSNYVIHDWKRESRKKPKLIYFMIKSAMIYFKKWGFQIF